MDFQSPLDNDFPSPDGGLMITETAKDYLAETAKWGKFLAIIGFVGIGFMVVVALGIILFGGTMLAGMPGGDPYAAVGGMALLGGIYLVGAALYFFPTLYLYRFSARTKRALQTNDTTTLTEALENLKSLYKFFGIITAIFVGIYALFFVIALVGGGLSSLLR